MKLRSFILALVLCVPAGGLRAEDWRQIPDPYVRVVELEGPNGARAYLAPNELSKTFRMKVRVGVGFEVEDDDQYGISHLLEHYLFTDSKLNPDSTYLEEIKERGGSANATTSVRETNFYATIPPEHADWMMESFAKMLLNRSFDRTQLELSKKPVFVEIGEPDALSLIWSTGLDNIVFPKFITPGGFWQTEFGVQGNDSSRLREKSNTVRFEPGDVARHYHDYYHPENITVFVSGRFDPVAVRDFLDKTFFALPRNPAGKKVPDWAPRPAPGPYVRRSVDSDVPTIRIGTKFWGISAADYLVLDVYLDYLAHRMMKELRNTRGSTYTVNSWIQRRQDFGYAVVSLDSLASEFSHNLDRVSARIEGEATQGRLTEVQFREAMNLYSSHYRLVDQDSSAMEDLSESLEENSRVLKGKGSSFDLYKNLTYAEFRDRLHALFRPDRAYYDVRYPPPFFKHDPWVWFLLALAGCLGVARSLMSAPFSHVKVRMVRKLASPPIYLMEAGLLGIGALFATYTYYLLLVPIHQTRWVQSSWVFSTYGGLAVAAIDVVFWGVLALSMVVRKVIISDGTLYLKSMTYFSRRYLVSEIEQVRVISPFIAFFSFSVIWSVAWRFFYTNPRFWQPGVWVHFRDGRGIFIGAKDPRGLAADLVALCAKDSNVRELKGQGGGSAPPTVEAA